MKKIITGFHSIDEILKAEKFVREKNEKTFSSFEIVYSKTGPRVKKILELAKNLKVPIRQEDEKYLNSYTEHLPEQLKNHRGIILILETEKESMNLTLEEFSARMFQKETAITVILDSITDPHNIGSIIRSADQFGIDGIIVPENKSAGGFETIAKTSAGASAWIPIITVPNLVRAAERLKKDGFWIYGADAGGIPVSKEDFPKKTVLVMGSEGSGISRLLEESCDKIISIPTQGKLDSLNVSVAAGILFYEIRKSMNK
ncbi:23S rRNA (guanosine(2251)-2'-O)-methyltransferase RlmB [Treponema pedis]|uniref:RNA methyltransferase n=1 Tax=Treponema pedis str. T A4 TaxID=1291379 RepID=S5ZNP0_9SPIR|nr:23S rRNA (guanosine(2251)-2'-O)-methyltransferase RlmB [Treponema pedis]AGT44207.1 RNA methyltransferase [Treponema pedis str. T A4]